MFHHLDPLTVRAAFPDAADVFLATVSAVPADRWEEPCLGEWTVRELTGHALRSFSTLRRLCDTTPDEHVGETFVGPMRLAGYLPTRVVEVALHTLDLQAAIGQPLLLPASAANVTLGVLAELADLPVLLLAMTGRQALPTGFNVIA